MALKQRLEKLECHFTWDLTCSKNEFRQLLGTLNKIEQKTCTWRVHYYNLVGFIQWVLDLNTEALDNLQTAEREIQEQGTKEAEVRLMVNKANLAWVYYHLGDVKNSTRYLEEVERLQQMFPAPSGCTLHPEVSGEKGWTLVKFDLREKKQQSIPCFRMALKAEPERKEWQKGLAITLSKTDLGGEESVELLKIVCDKEPENLLLHALYLLKLFEVHSEHIVKQMEDLLEKSLKTGDLEPLGVIVKYFRTISKDKAIQAAERAREMFPDSMRTLKHLAMCYKWKVYDMKEESREKETLAIKASELFEEFVKHCPYELKAKIDLASMYRHTYNSARVDEIYRELLEDIHDCSFEMQQHIYYNYAWHHFLHKRYHDAVSYHMKVAEIPSDTPLKQKSLNILQKTAAKTWDPRCEEVQLFLEKLMISD